MIATISGRMKAAPKGGGTPLRSLTRSLDHSKEGLMPQSTRNKYYFDPSACIEFHGSLSRYQEHAAAALTDSGVSLFPWDWITPHCGTENCVNSSHLAANRNVRLAYAPGQCIYCGQPGHTKDHLLPRAWTGEAQRRFTVTVPSCAECNRLLGATFTWSITERRAILNARLRRKKRRVLASKDFTSAEIDEFGPGLRTTIVRGMAEKDHVLRRLAFPDDPHFDLRALEKSGIENAWAIGLLMNEGDDLDRIVAAALSTQPTKGQKP